MPTAGGGPARKIFVGSLPDGITDGVLRDHFSQYGVVEDIFIKMNAEPGRMWAFITFSTPDQAATAISMNNGTLQFTGSARPCEVTLARHQGMFGQDPLLTSPAPAYEAAPYDPSQGAATENQMAPRKIFVGSLPDTVTDPVLREEFAKYGQVLDVFIKASAEPGRGWAFITFATSEEAQYARNSCNRVLTFPGSEKPCEVTMAKHQGMFGKDPIEPRNPGAVPAPQHAGVQYQQPQAIADGPKKVFVGSLPDTITDQALRSEFSKYGQIIDLFLKTTCESGRQWSFITFATSQQAQYAKDSTDRILLFPGADRPCEVMFSKNQGKFGQAPLAAYGGGVAPQPAPVVQHVAQQVVHHVPRHVAPTVVHAPPPQAVQPPPPAGGPQPPPPDAPPPAHLTPWRMYKTASGLPYYHNATTGVTTWDCPPDLQVPDAAPLDAGRQRYSPY